MSPSVTYLGYRIDSASLHPLPSKFRAVVEAPCPSNTKQLKSFLGLLKYYIKFLPNLSSIVFSLNKLLQKGTHLKWGDKQQEAFEKTKTLLTSADFLAHFNPILPILLACDASYYGVGAVLAHRMLDGSEWPIAYASKSLSKAERNHSQLEKEGLSCVFGVNKFRSYLLGHHFDLITDHKPLLTINHY